jgi:sugar phosphate isomerase/epimerase
METKREFLKKLGLIAVGGMVGGRVLKASATETVVTNLAKKKNIGLQLYSLGNELTNDVPAGLKKVVGIGYTSGEAAGYSNGKIYNYEMDEFRKIADDAGLAITGTHVSPSIRNYTKENAGEVADFWKKAIDDNIKCGVKTIVQPSMPAIESVDDLKMIGEVFNKAGEIAKAAGIKWGYHNHNREFDRVGNDQNPRQGTVIYDGLLQNTDPNLVFFEMDVYWAVMGQADPVEYFEKYAGRFPLLHIKDRAVLGKSGMMNFESIFTKAYENGLDEYYVEIEGIRNGMTQFEGVEQCYAYLGNAKFVK